MTFPATMKMGSLHAYERFESYLSLSILITAHFFLKILYLPPLKISI